MTDQTSQPTFVIEGQTLASGSRWAVLNGTGGTLATFNREEHAREWADWMTERAAKRAALDLLEVPVPTAPIDARASQRQTVWPFAEPCGCNLETGRCEVHAAMMQTIRAAWFEGSADRQAIVEEFCDGFAAGLGSLGDWSGVRDSSPEAVEEMFAALTAEASPSLAARASAGLCSHPNAAVCDAAREHIEGVEKKDLGLL